MFALLLVPFFNEIRCGGEIKPAGDGSWGWGGHFIMLQPCFNCGNSIAFWGILKKIYPNLIALTY